jgi:hypothetical protein
MNKITPQREKSGSGSLAKTHLYFAQAMYYLKRRLWFKTVSG